MAVPATTRREETRREPERLHRKKTPRWRDPRAIAIVVAALVLLGGAVAYAATTGQGSPDGPSATSQPPPPASQRDEPLPTGLSVTRQAAYDPQTETVELTLTYQAQSAELGGPFLEIIPGTDGGDCPTVSWDGDPQQQNVPSSGIRVDCGWSVDPGAVPAQGSTQVTATVPLTFDDPGTELQAWLDDAAAQTQATISDGEVTSLAYPAQRLQGIDVKTPSSIVSDRTLTLSVLPIWPDGADELNPLYRSPSVGTPTSALTAVAGGEAGVRFSDGCSGALQVSGDGLVVTTLSTTTDCSVLTTVGNFKDVPSRPFDIVPRAS